MPSPMIEIDPVAPASPVLSACPCAAAAVALLDQTATVVGRLPAALYSAPCAAAHGSSVGGHVRHLLDHYAAIAASLDAGGGPIAYDHRARGTPAERSPAEALGVIRGLRARLGGLARADMDRPVRVLVMLSGEGEEGEFGSTLGRELAFATHHAVHHHALVRIIADHLGVGVPEGLGVAPSTARHGAGSPAR